MPGSKWPGGGKQSYILLTGCVNKRLDQLALQENALTKMQRDIKHQIKQARNELKSIQRKYRNASR